MPKRVLTSFTFIPATSPEYLLPTCNKYALHLPSQPFPFLADPLYSKVDLAFPRIPSPACTPPDISNSSVDYTGLSPLGGNLPWSFRLEASNHRSHIPSNVSKVTLDSPPLYLKVAPVLDLTGSLVVLSPVPSPTSPCMVVTSLRDAVSVRIQRHPKHGANLSGGT